MALRRDRHSAALGAAVCLLLSLLSSRCLGLRPVREQTQTDGRWSDRLSQMLQTAKDLLGREWTHTQSESLVHPQVRKRKELPLQPLVLCRVISLRSWHSGLSYRFLYRITAWPAVDACG